MKWTVVDLIIIVTCSVIAAASARPYVGSANDASRLACVESLVDRHTWKIDHSFFMGDAEGGSPRIWTPGEPRPNGFEDKLLIGGHYYSDKPPINALVMAAEYQAIQWTTGLVARENPNAYCYWMTLVSSGVAYVIAVWCLYRSAGLIGLSLRTSLIFTASFALATILPAYIRQVNASVIFLAVVSVLLLIFLRFSETGLPITSRSILAAGCVTGFGYTTDLGSGPVLVLCVAAYLFYVTGDRVRSLVLFGLGAFPWFVGHHALNYMIGGTFLPMNTVPEYFQWPGSPFNEKNLTGAGSGHESFQAFALYALRFLIRNKGLLSHNLELFLAIPALIGIIRTKGKSRPLVLALTAWGIGTWLLYAWKSRDFSGYCVSIRWLVPSIVAGYLILAIHLRESTSGLRDFVVISLFTLPIAAYDWTIGTWYDFKLPILNTYVSVTLSICLILHVLMRFKQSRRESITYPSPADH